MTQRPLILLAVLGFVLMGCGASPPGPGSPTAAATTDTGSTGRVTITTVAGLELAFDVDSCSSPGPKIARIEGSGPDGTLVLAVSVEGVLRITGPVAAEAEVTELEVRDDGSVSASGTMTLASAPDAPVPFQLTATPGTCR